MSKLFSACVFVAALSAFGDWPPHGEGLTKYIDTHKSQIEELVSEFERSGFGRIDCQPCFANESAADWNSVSYKFLDEKWRRVENPRSQEFAKLFRNAGVMSVFRRSNGAMELGIAVPSDHMNRRYVVQLFHDPEHRASTLKECVAEFEDIDCGWCKVSIDDNLWVRYQWYLDDPDPNASQARDNGDISWDEWAARSAAAEGACLKEGLKKQGYDSNAN
ncbi:MAG: hypothetical protein WBN32_15105 [Woeseia sp.]